MAGDIDSWHDVPTVKDYRERVELITGIDFEPPESRELKWKDWKNLVHFLETEVADEGDPGELAEIRCSSTTFLAVVAYTWFVFAGGMLLAASGQSTTTGPSDFAFDEKDGDTMEKAVFLKYESFGLNVTEVYTDSHKDFLICVEDRRKRAPSDTIVLQTRTQHEHDGTETRFPLLLSEAG